MIKIDIGRYVVLMAVWKSFLTSLLAQGLSVAGGQGGLRDGRSALVRYIFKTADKLPRLWSPQLSCPMAFVWSLNPIVWGSCWCLRMWKRYYLNKLSADVCGSTSTRTLLVRLLSDNSLKVLFFKSFLWGMQEAQFCVDMVHCSTCTRRLTSQKLELCSSHANRQLSTTLELQ